MSAADKKNNCAIKVYMRQRPLSTIEIEQKCTNIVHAVNAREVLLKSGFNERKFVCDHVFGEKITQSELYNATLSPMINNVIAGYNCTLFAYGQTGSGKTHTIFGGMKQPIDMDMRKDNSVGLILRASQHLFADLSKLNARTEYTVRISFVEIHNEEVRDLFGDNVLLRVYDDPLVKGSICMKDLSKVTVFNSRDVFDWINIGLQARQKTTHSPQNSRSHVIFTFLVNVREITTRGDEIIKTGRLQLLDLAGNENMGRERARDGGNLNRSINTLTRVIKALAQKMQHIPYRDSKLTRILQDSLSGNTKTAIIATFSPSSGSWDETLATLELGQLARSIITNAHVNVNRKQANLLKELDDEVGRLKEELVAAKRGEGVFVSSETYEKMTGDANNGKQTILELVGKIAELGNHRSSLDMQCRSMEQSFNKTKDYLEIMNQMLAERLKVLREEEIKMETALAERKYMADVTNTLLDVCNNSTQNEEIYYRKFQEKSAANKRNAQISKEMLATASSCFQDIYGSTQKSFSETLTALKEVQKMIAVFSNQTLDGVRCMDQIASDTRRYSDKYNIILNEVLLCNDECRIKTVQDFIASMFGRNLENLDGQDVIRKSIETIWRKYEEDMRAMATQSEKTFESVLNTIHQSEALVEESNEALSNIVSLFHERREAIREQRRQNEAAAAVSKGEIARAEQEKQDLVNRAAALGAALGTIKATQDENANIDLQRVQESVINYLEEPSKIVSTSVSSMESFLKQIDTSRSVISNQAATDRRAIGQQVTGLAATVNQNLVQQNSELRDLLQKWQDSLNGTVREKLAQKTMPITDQTDAILRGLSREQLQRNMDIKKRFAEVIKSLGQCNTNINGVGHAGDTPAKRTYSYPRKFNVNGTPNGLSNEREN